MNVKTLIVILVIISQIACVFYISSRKQEFNIDEMYSYILSNSYHVDRLSNADDIWDRWTDTDVLKKYVTVQEGERFAFDRVYLNNSKDCHPPLYYWLLHSVCSFIPDVFTKWTGLGLNIFLFLLTLIGIYKISIITFDDSGPVFLPIILYGFSPIAMETVTFIRMYMLITLFAVILMYVHLLMFRSGITRNRLLAAGLILYLGSMTHYYFIVMGFWAAAIFLIQNIKRSRRATIKYGLGCIAAEALFLLSYPHVINHTFGSTTNNVGGEIRRNLFNWELWGQQIDYLAVSQIKALSYQWILSIVLTGVLISFAVIVFVRHMRGSSSKERMSVTKGEGYVGRFIIWTGGVYACTFLSVSFIGGEYVFLRYIYFTGPALYILIAYMIKKLFLSKTKAAHCMVLILLVFSAANAAYGAFSDASPYLNRDDYKKDMLLRGYGEEPLIMMTGRNPAVPTGNLTKITLFDSFYMSDEKNILDQNIIGECIKRSGECIIFINTDRYYTDGYDAATVLDKIRHYDKDMELEHDHLCEGPLGEFYRISVRTL